MPTCGRGTLAVERGVGRVPIPTRERRHCGISALTQIPEALPRTRGRYGSAKIDDSFLRATDCSRREEKPSVCIKIKFTAKKGIVVVNRIKNKIICARTKRSAASLHKLLMSRESIREGRMRSYDLAQGRFSPVSKLSSLSQPLVAVPA